MSSFLFSFLSYGPYIAQNSAFLQICADLSKKSKSIKAIYLYPSERPRHALSEFSMLHSDLSNSSQDIEDENIKSADSAEI